MKKLVTAACIVLLAASCTSEKKENQAAINTGESLFETVKYFVQLGEHRTATAVDSSTFAWLKSEFDSLGAKTEFIEFPLSQFFFEEGKLTSDSLTVAVFPVWPVKEGLQLSLSGKAIAGDQLKTLSDVKGKIVLTHLTHQHGASTPEIKAQIDTFIHAGAIAVLVVPENNTGEIVALNTFENQKEWDVPVYEIAPKDTAIVVKSISDKKTLTIDVKGAIRQVTARSVLAKIGTGKEYVVVSTPISGWFRTGGERGPGIAVWLGLAKWVKAHAEQFKDYTFVFIGNSGHELNNMGAHVFADKAAPKPEDTRLWIHLGAAVAVREWKEENGQWTLTDSVDSKRSIYYDEAVANSFEKSFEQLKAKKTKGTKENQATVKPGGEGVVYQQHGYKNLVSIAYGHRLHHVKTDDEQSTSPQLLLELEQTLEQFITLELTAQ